MIRQAISCDICASEKKQTNHWFVAYEQAGELRVSGWCSRNRQRPGAKHLCGQTCLHKLVDDFMARTLVKSPSVAENYEQEQEASYPAITSSQYNDTSLTAPARSYARVESSPHVDASLTASSRIRSRVEASTRSRTEAPAYAQTETFGDDFESSARLIPSPAAAPAATTSQPIHRVPAELVRMPGRAHGEERTAAPPDEPRYSSRNWRSEAWERERERELRAAARLRSNG